MPAPLPHNEADRLDALRACGILDTPRTAEFDDLTQLASEVCDVPISAVSLIDDHRQWFKSIVGIDATETPRDLAFCAHTILDAFPLVINDAQLDTRFSANPLVTGDPHIRFYAGVPLVGDEGYAFGSLCVIDKKPRTLSSKQMHTLQILARQVVSLLELNRRIAMQDQLIAERDRSNASLLRSEAILREAQCIAKIGSWEMDLATNQSIFSEEMFRILQLDPESPVPAMDALRELYDLNDLAALDILIANAIETNTSYSSDVRVYLPDGSVKWCHAVGSPAADENGNVVRLVGTLMDITDRKLAEELVRDYGIALEYSNLELKDANDRLQEANLRLTALSTEDALTGLKNHRAFHEALEHEVARWSRSGSHLGLIMLDVDHFKQYNDTYGHPAGDAVLLQVADILRRSVRDFDISARYGGEEFAIILPGANPDRAASIGERLRSAIAEAPWPHRAITASIGVAMLGEPAMDARSLVVCADRALYQSKRSGRNRVTLASNVMDSDEPLPRLADSAPVPQREGKDVGAAGAPSNGRRR